MDPVNPYIVRYPTSEFQTTNTERLNSGNQKMKEKMSKTTAYDDKVNVYNDNAKVQMVVKCNGIPSGDLRIEKGRLYVHRLAKTPDFGTRPRRDTVKEYNDLVAIVVEVPYPSGEKTDFVFIPDVNGETEKNKTLYSVIRTMHGNQLELKPEINSLIKSNPRKYETESIILTKLTKIDSVKAVVMRSTTKVTLEGEIDCELEIKNSDLTMFNGWLRDEKNVNIQLESFEKNEKLCSVKINVNLNQLELKPRKYEIDALLELNPRQYETDSIILKQSTNIQSVKEVVMSSHTKVTLKGDIDLEVEIENSDLALFNGWLRENKNVNIQLKLENQFHFNFGTFHDKNNGELRKWLQENWDGFSIEKNSEMRYKDIEQENFINRSIEEKNSEEIKKKNAWGWWSVRHFFNKKTDECFNFEMVDDVRPWNGS